MSDHAFEFLERKLRECKRKHVACRSTEEARLPTRIVRVALPGEPDDPDARLRLVETDGRPGRYAALSHCWGDRRPFCTTRSNIQQMTAAIDERNLSPVFADAVSVCRRLGIPYLWVDSLCIVQDDTADWEAESAKMADYYAHAFLTISASSSPHGGISFLNGTRDSRWTPQDFVFGGEAGGPAVAVAMRRIPGDNWMAGGFEGEIDPLNSRAWAWQEALLSSRIASYGVAGLVWDCRTECVSEDGADGQWLSDRVFSRELSSVETRAYIPAADRRLPQHKKGTGSINVPVMPSRDDNLDGWRRLVEDFTRHRITVPTDRLPALSGVASRVQASLQTRYLAGLWECTLLRDMCWFQHPQLSMKSARDAPSRHSRRAPAAYIAPSWSWASIGMPVTFMPPVQDSDLELLEAYCHVPGHNPLGHVARGHLRVRGRIFTMTVRSDNPEPSSVYSIEADSSSVRWDYTTPYMDSTMVANGATLRRATKDDVLQFPLRGQAFYLFLGTTSKKNFAPTSLFHYGLLLGLVDATSETYCRLGLLEGLDDHRMNFAEKRTITIV